ncbi:TPA: ABC transporter permease [Streptococcus agalactiae]|nr:ABC transporter permease [Streptococcus agalactiae]
MVIMINFFRHFWESLKNLKRNFWMTFASVTSVTITLLLVGLFSSVLLNVEKLTTDVSGNFTISAFLNVDSTDAQKQVKDKDGKLKDNPDYHKVYDKIKRISGVEKVTYSSKAEQLKEVQKEYGSDVIDDTYKDALLDVYVVGTSSTKVSKSVSEAIGRIEGVDYTKEPIDSTKLSNLTDNIRIWGFGGVALLIVLAIFLISNTIRMSIMSRRTDIEIMRLVGAKNSYIRGPFFFEGAWVGILGAIVPSLIFYFGYQFVFNKFNPKFETSHVSLYPMDIMVPAIIGGMVIIGIIIGSLGSVLSMRRYLKI